MVESITYKYINGNLAQEYAANWKVESQNLPSGSTIETSEVPSQLTITVPANNTSSTRSGKIVLLQPASGKRITLNYSQETNVKVNSILMGVYKDSINTQLGVLSFNADYPINSAINFDVVIRYGVSSGDTRTYSITMPKNERYLEYRFSIQPGANPEILHYSYNPTEDNIYKYTINIL